MAHTLDLMRPDTKPDLQVCHKPPSFWCQKDSFSAPDQVRTSPISNCKYEPCLIYTIPRQAASNGSHTVAYEKEQT